MLSENLWRVFKVYVAFFVLAVLYTAFSDGFYLAFAFLLIFFAGLMVFWFYWLKKRVKPFLVDASVVLNKSLGGHEKIILLIAVLPLVLLFGIVFYSWVEGVILLVIVAVFFYFFLKWLLGRAGVKSVFNGFEGFLFSFLKKAWFKISSFLNVNIGGEKIVLGEVEQVLKKKISSGSVRSFTEFYWVDDPQAFILNPEKELNRHGLVVGSSGTGKSNFLKTLTSKLSVVEKVHVVDPHGEYAKSFNGRVVNLGEQGLNLWGLDGKTASYRVHENVDVLTDVLDLGAQQTYFLTMAARNAFVRKGFDLHSSEVEDLEPPSFEDVLVEVRKLEKQSSSVKTLCRKLEGLLWSNLFPARDSFNIEFLMNENVCFNAGNIPSSGQKKLFTEIYLRKVYHTVASTQRKSHLTVIIDEAESLIVNPDDYGGKGYESYADRLSAEARKFNVGLVLGTQRCTALSRSLVQNAGLFVSFYVQEPVDAKYVAKLLCGNSSDEWKLSVVQEKINVLERGECVVMSSGVYREPVVVRTSLFKEKGGLVQKQEALPKQNAVQKSLTEEERELIKLPEVKTEVLLEKELKRVKTEAPKVESVEGDRARREKRILSNIRRKGFVKVGDVMRFNKVSKRTAVYDLNSLISQGLVEKKGNTNSTIYVFSGSKL